MRGSGGDRGDGGSGGAGAGPRVALGDVESAGVRWSVLGIASRTSLSQTGETIRERERETLDRQRERERERTERETERERERSWIDDH